MIIVKKIIQLCPVWSESKTEGKPTQNSSGDQWTRSNLGLLFTRVRDTEVADACNSPMSVEARYQREQRETDRREEKRGRRGS